MLLLRQRTFLVLCFLFLVGCSPSQCRQWIFQEVRSNFHCYNGGKLILEPENEYCHLELEIIRNRSGIRFFIILLDLQARPIQTDSARTKIEILFQDQKFLEIYPFLFEGHQRILIPEDIAEILIQALLDGQSFIIQSEWNKIEVIPENFSQAYQALLKIPIELQAK